MEEVGEVGVGVEAEFFAETEAAGFYRADFAAGKGGYLFGGELEVEEGAEALFLDGEVRESLVEFAIEFGVHLHEVVFKFLPGGSWLQHSGELVQEALGAQAVFFVAGAEFAYNFSQLGFY